MDLAMVKPTDGPWRAVDTYVVKPHEGDDLHWTVAQTQLTPRYGVKIPRSEAEANARIMAASIEMLEALQKCVAYLDPSCTSILEQIRFAINKATGVK